MIYVPPKSEKRDCGFTLGIKVLSRGSLVVIFVPTRGNECAAVDGVTGNSIDCDGGDDKYKFLKTHFEPEM